MHDDKWDDFRVFLKELLHDPAVRRLIERHSDISSRTLARWTSGETDEPDRKRLAGLLQALPHYRDQLLTTITKAIPDFDVPLIDNTRNFQEEVPQAFWLRLLETNATTPGYLHFHAVVDLIFLQLQTYVDPEQIGVYMTLIGCSPPPDPSLPIASLREIVTRTTYHPKSERITTHSFMGVETLSGHTVSTGLAHVIQDLSEERLLPFRKASGLNSAAAYPVQRAGKIAGCLLITSSQTHAFQMRLQYLLQIYSHFLALAFDSSQFYDPSMIKLRQLPPLANQHTYLARFPDYLLAILRRDPTLTRTQAEILAWQKIEKELLSLDFTML